MSGADERPEPPPPRPAPLPGYGGLCAVCRHARPVTSSKGSRFLLCGLAAADPAFPRYPPQPVLVCSGHQR